MSANHPQNLVTENQSAHSSHQGFPIGVPVKHGRCLALICLIVADKRLGASRCNNAKISSGCLLLVRNGKKHVQKYWIVTNLVTAHRSSNR